MCASAPGKIVLWGEYAVLGGAPAAVLAVQRRARVTLAPALRDWTFQAQGFPAAPVTLTDPAFAAPQPATALPLAVLRGLGLTELPHPFALTCQSTAFFEAGRKLGIGSSAAVCVALCAAFARWLDKPLDMALAIAIHRDFQGGSGSGLDVASAWHGDVIRFREGAAHPVDLPPGLHRCVVFTGVSASTPAHLGRFSAWRRNSNIAPLDALADASDSLFDASSAETFLALLDDYASRLRRLDEAASLNIFTPAHDALQRLASKANLVYKPCGAGGGDIGIAFGASPAAVDDFQQQAAAAGYLPLDMETAQHGIRISP